MASEFRSGVRPTHHHRDMHPLQVVSVWGGAVAAGDTDGLMGLYAADAQLHLDGASVVAPRHVQARLQLLAVFGSGRRPTVRGLDDSVVARWDDLGPGAEGLEARCRVAGGRIVEQWIAEPTALGDVSTIERATGAVAVTTTRGDVKAEAVEYAHQRLSQVTAHVHEPILAASITLSLAPDPARDRPAMAQARLDVNGSLLGAHVAAHDMHEAVDLLVRRLADRIEHRAEKLDTRRRQLPGRPGPGQWRHADPRAVRPTYFDRAVEERQLIRHKAFYPDEQTIDEAIFDMDQLDYGFYLFCDLDTGQDSLVERLPSGGHRLQQVAPSGGEAGGGLEQVEQDPRPVPELTVQAAMDQLSATGESFVFFADAQSGRGCVVYRRYDGHYGLITLE